MCLHKTISVIMTTIKITNKWILNGTVSLGLLFSQSIFGQDLNPADSSGSTNSYAYTNTYFPNFNPSPVFVYPTNATLLWELPLNNGVSFAPLVGVDGTIYFMDIGNTLSAVNSNGTIKWLNNLLTWGQKQCGSIGPDGTIYIPTGNGLAAVNATNGSINWTFAQAVSPPAVDPNGVVYATSSTGVFAITNGVQKWLYQTNDSFYGGSFSEYVPVIGADGTIYVGSYNGYLYAITPSGSLKWSIFAEYNTQGGTAIASDGTIYYLEGGLGQPLVALNTNGSVKWTYQPTNSLAAAFDFEGTPVIGSDGTIYIMAVGNYSYSPDILTNTLYALTPTGSVKWTTPIAAAYLEGDEQSGLQLYACACAIASDGEIYVTSTAGIVYSLAPNGTTNWAYQTDSQFLSAPVIGPNGTLYVASYSNPNLFAFQGLSGVACSAWPEYRKNARNTAAVAVANISLPIMTTNGFQMTITGSTNVPVCPCATSDLINWTNIGQTVLTGGKTNFVDIGSSNYPYRFYRAFPQ